MCKVEPSMEDQLPVTVRTPRAILLSVDRTVITRDFTRLVVAKYVVARCQRFVNDMYYNISFDVVFEQLQLQSFRMFGPSIVNKPDSTCLDIEPYINSVCDYVIWCFKDLDERDSVPLKKFRSKLMMNGFDGAEPISTWIYKDVKTSFNLWHSKGIQLHLFSDDQKYLTKRMMGKTVHGDMDMLVERYYDIESDGSPNAPATYSKMIANKKLAFPPEQIVFVSHSMEQVIAASGAGLGVMLVCSHEADYIKLSQADRIRYPVIRSLLELTFLHDAPFASSLTGSVNERFGVLKEDQK